MDQPLPILFENSIQIAWDYLERTGEIDDAFVASRFLSDTIGIMIRRGERRKHKMTARDFSHFLTDDSDLPDPDILQVGQELRILPFSGLIHEGRPGDTLASVANSYDALIQDVIGAAFDIFGITMSATASRSCCASHGDVETK